MCIRDRCSKCGLREFMCKLEHRYGFAIFGMSESGNGTTALLFGALLRRQWRLSWTPNSGRRLNRDSVAKIQCTYALAESVVVAICSVGNNDALRNSGCDGLTDLLK